MKQLLSNLKETIILGTLFPLNHDYRRESLEFNKWLSLCPFTTGISPLIKCQPTRARNVGRFLDGARWFGLGKDEEGEITSAGKNLRWTWMATPRKINMEPQNEGLEDVFPFQMDDFQVPC